MSQAPNMPLKEFRSGPVRGSKWMNDVQTADGVSQRPNYKVNKVYREGETEQYKETPSFSPDEIPHLFVVALWSLLDRLLGALGLVSD
jgi:hypothetical protein